MRIGPYQLHQPIGEGGMATVWGGVHRTLGTQVAFKFLRPRSDKTKQTLRFLDETRALARMDHPGVIRIFDAGICTPAMSAFLDGVDEGSPYFVMEAITGGDLKNQRPTNWDECRELLLSLLDALAHAHARDVIHRDIKPANILIEVSGNPRLTDFGISRLSKSPAASERMTGTPSYMAPEQVLGDAKREGPWTDLYAIGCLTHWLVSGSSPFRGTVQEVLESHVNAAAPDVEPVFPVPEGLQKWLDGLLEKDPQARFPRAADAAFALSLLGPADVEASASFDPVPSGEFPTLTVIWEDGLDIETSSGGEWRGLAPPVPASWRTTDVMTRSPLVASGPGMLPHRQPTFRGREEARDQLWTLLRETSESAAARSVAVVGPSGSGCSELIRWFGRRAHEVGAAHTLVFNGRELRDDILDQLRSWWGSVGGWHGATVFFAQRPVSPEFDDWDLEQLRLIASGRAPSVRALKAIHSRWMTRLGRDRVVLMFGESEAAIGYLSESRSSSDGPRLLLTSSDSAEELDHTIELDRLEQDTIEGIIGDLVALAPASARRIAERADGNPGIAVSIVREAARRDLFNTTDVGLDISAELVRELFEQLNHPWDDALERISPNLRRTAQVVAAVGSQFSTEEVALICQSMGIETSSLAFELADNGLARVSRRHLSFVTPLARQAIAAENLSIGEHAAVANAFRGGSESARNLRRGVYHAFSAGMIDLDEVVRTSRTLRNQSETAEALRLLDAVRAGLTAPLELGRVDLEKVECHLSRQAYAEAIELLAGLPAELAETPDAHALQLFIRLRSFEDVRDELRSFQPEGLGETGSRMLAYAWMDLGMFDEARQLLLDMNAQHDPEGRSYALARLEFLRQNWTEAERWGNEAADGFEKIGRLDGVPVALDIVASARLNRGRVDDAISLYRENLKTGRRLAAPTFVQAYNLATCLLDAARIDEEVENLLEETVAATLQRKRTDVEHVARAAQLRSAVMLQDERLVLHRLKKLESFELGPWVNADAAMHLRSALENALEPGVAQRIEKLADACDEILRSNTDA